MREHGHKRILSNVCMLTVSTDVLCVCVCVFAHLVEGHPTRPASRTCSRPLPPAGGRSPGQRSET